MTEGLPVAGLQMLQLARKGLGMWIGDKL
ncbi:MAG: hypothetical protein RJA72_300, partial [Pseudomonadota bacterium]